MARSVLKILFVVHRVHPNLRGPRRALQEAGIDCHFVASSSGPSEGPPPDNLTVLSPSLLHAREAKGLVERIKPDLVVQRNFSGGFIEFWRAAQELGVQRIVYDQDPSIIPVRDFFLRPLRVMRLGRDLLLKRIRLGPIARVTPVKHWGDPRGFAFKDATYLPFPAYLSGENHTQDSTRSLRVISVAKHGQKRKRIVWLLRALEQSPYPFDLDIVGSSPAPDEAKRVDRFERLRRTLSPAEERPSLVRFHTDLDEESVYDLYRSADLFVLPSKREMFAISPLEAMAAGLPVLISSDGGAVSYVRPGGVEQIFPSNSYRAFRKSLYRLLSDRNLRGELRTKNSHLVRKEHAPEKFVATLLDFCA